MSEHRPPQGKIYRAASGRLVLSLGGTTLEDYSRLPVEDALYLTDLWLGYPIVSVHPKQFHSALADADGYIHAARFDVDETPSHINLELGLWRLVQGRPMPSFRVLTDNQGVFDIHLLLDEGQDDEQTS